MAITNEELRQLSAEELTAKLREGKKNSLTFASKQQQDSLSHMVVSVQFAKRLLVSTQLFVNAN